MATQKETLERLLNKEEIIYWAAKGGIAVEEFPGGLFVDEWKVNLNTEDYIASVERRLDEPESL
jgi:hypothetical protein